MATIEKRESKNGKVSYRVKVRLKGYPEISETFTTKTLAKEWADKTQSDIRGGMRLIVREAKKRTVEELIDLYVNKVLPYKGNGAVDTKRHLEVWRQLVGKYALININTKMILDAREKIQNMETRGKKKSCSTVNRYMAALSVVFSYAVKELEWIDDNPISKISHLQEPKPRVRYLSDEERENLLESARNSTNPYIYAIVLVALTTGARKMEILRLRWEDIDFNANTAILWETKNGEYRVLQLIEPALEELKKLYAKRGKSPYVFPSHDGSGALDITYCWKDIIRTAGIENFRFHDLRHTCASYLAMTNVNMATIAEILGHKDFKITKRYAHLSPGYKRSVMEDTAKIYFTTKGDGDVKA
ncbi:MAG: site-specific integrase [Alphaproteobacteria bacterium]|nr:site-specific integrase [Alphaproteobacteria bacterium]